jgi:hypothetical protein
MKPVGLGNTGSQLTLNRDLRSTCWWRKLILQIVQDPITGSANSEKILRLWQPLVQSGFMQPDELCANSLNGYQPANGIPYQDGSGSFKVRIEDSKAQLSNVTIS